MKSVQAPTPRRDARARFLPAGRRFVAVPMRDSSHEIPGGTGAEREGKERMMRSGLDRVPEPSGDATSK